MVKITTGTMGSVLGSANSLRTAMFSRRMATKKVLAFRTMFSHENTAHSVLALMLYKVAKMCTERQTCCKYQCCGIFAKGISACDRVSSS